MADKPVESYRFGACQCAVWKNTGSKGDFFTVSGVTRTYYDKDNKPQNTTTLRASDIKDAQLCLEEAYKFIRTKKESKGSNVDDEAD